MALAPPPLAPQNVEAEACLSGIFGADILRAVGDAFNASGGDEDIEAFVISFLGNNTRCKGLSHVEVLCIQ